MHGSAPQTGPRCSFLPESGDLGPCGESRGTSYSRGTVADEAVFDLLDVARRLHNSQLASTVDLLRLVEDEAVEERWGL